MPNVVDIYYEALERLKERGAKINYDTVAVEAGRGVGSIKGSREVFKQLREDIRAAGGHGTVVRPSLSSTVNELKIERLDLRRQLDDSLSREFSLILEVFELRKELAALRGGNVFPIKGL